MNREAIQRELNDLIKYLQYADGINYTNDKRRIEQLKKELNKPYQLELF